jgi:hypothetical protein
MPFEPSLDEPGALVCTLCSSTVPSGELISHVCVPRAIRDRQAAPPAAGPETPPQAPQPGVETFLGTGAPLPGAVGSILEEPPPDGPLGAEQLAAVDEKIYFTLGGETFRGVEELSFGVQLDVAKAFETNEIAAAALVSLIRGIVHPDDEARFERVIYSKTIRIEATELRDALVSVIRAIGGRPSPGSSA